MKNFFLVSALLLLSSNAFAMGAPQGEAGNPLMSFLPLILFWIITLPIVIVIIMISSSSNHKKGIYTKSKTVAYVLWFFLGGWSAHKFYLGKTGLAILYLLTGQLFGIGWIIDLFILGGQVDTYNALYGKGPQSEDKNIVINLTNPTESKSNSNEKITADKQILVLSERIKTLSLKQILTETNLELEEAELSLKKLIEKGLCTEKTGIDGKKVYDFT